MALVMQSGADGFDFSMLREVPQRVVNAGPVSFPFDLVDVEIIGESYSLDFPDLDANSGLAALLRDDRLAGGRGDDVLLGGAGRDTLEGGAGQDILLADAGNDILRGGFGNDVLAALMGAHGLTGGKGRDIFGFGAGSIGSVIRDFRDGTDRIAFDIEGLTFADLRITQLGPDVVRVAGDGFAFRVAGLRVEDLGRADFLFGTAAQDSVAASLDAFLDGWAYSV